MTAAPKGMLATMATLAVLAFEPLPAQAQAAPMPGAVMPSPEQMQARQEIVGFEGALENAVGFGAQMLNQHVQLSSTPQQLLLSGQARARGFRLDGYGLVFDVEFPSIRRSVVWTMRMLDRPDPVLLAGLKELRRNSQGGVDQQTLQRLDDNIKELEDQIKAYDAQPKNVSTARGQAGSGSPPVPVEDPRRFYAGAMTNALMDAMLERGITSGVAPDEWLTVAARESLDLRYMADDAATTLTLRVKGIDLAALRDKRITPDEARKRIQVTQY
jgi:hypothetical protein